MSDITNNDPQIPSRLIKPVKFPKWVNNLGIIPTSYKDSMSFYEICAWLCKYLEDTVIPTVNQNGRAVRELQELYVTLKDYVDNYFDDLDIQEEINEKLDDMADKGQLTDIIAQYLELAGILAFDTVSSLKLAENIVNGSFVETYGFYAKGDGGGAKYIIRNKTNEDIVDEMFIIALSNNTLVAELMVEGEIINGLKLGLKNDSSQDISAKVNTVSEDYSIFLPAGEYLVSNTLTLKHSLYGEGFSRNNLIESGQTILNSTVENNTINLVGNAEYATQTIQNIKIKIDNSITDTNVLTYNPVNKQTRCYINEVTIINFCGTAINLNATSITGFISRGVYIDTICLLARPYQESTGIKCATNVSDNKFENLEMMYVKTGILNNSLNQIENVHIWCGGTGTDQDNWWVNTRGVINQNGGKLHFTSLYIDTASVAIANLNSITMIDEFTYWIDNSISGSNEYTASIVWGNNFEAKQNVIINNAIINIGTRVKYINGKITNLRLLYDSLSNLNFASLQDVENLQYALKYTQTSGNVSYVPIAIFALKGSGHGYSEIQIATDAGQNELIKCSSDYENNFVIKGFYFNKHNYYYYQIIDDKIIIYVKDEIENMFINVVVSSKSDKMFPITMNSLINKATNKFIGEDYVVTDLTNLTLISDEKLDFADLKRLTHERIVCIGDSYGTGRTAETESGYTDGWPIRLKTLRNISNNDFYNFSENSSGFIRTGHQGHTFLSLLQANYSTINNPESITKVVVCGGHNDYGSNTSSLNIAISAFITYVKEHFVNAEIYFGMIGNDSRANADGKTVRDNIYGYILKCWQSSTKFGVTYLSGIENIMHDYQTFMSTDGIHPNITGYEHLTGQINSCLNGGSADYVSSVMSKTFTATDSASTFYITTKNINDVITFGFNQNITIEYSTPFTWYSGDYLQLANSSPYNFAFHNRYIKIPVYYYTQDSSSHYYGGVGFLEFRENTIVLRNALLLNDGNAYPDIENITKLVIQPQSITVENGIC